MMNHKRTVTHTLYCDPAEAYQDRYSASWDEKQSWARFQSDEFQFTISRKGVAKLKELVDAFVEYGGESDGDL